MKFIVSSIILLLFLGCGYKPISAMSDSVVGDGVWVDVIMSKTDPQNTVALKDSVRQGIVSRLNGTLSDKNSAKNVIIANISKIDFSPILYDQFGYVAAYKASIVVNFKIKSQNGEISNIKTSGEYDFRIIRRIKNSRYTDSIISDKERYDAIKNASAEAFDEFMSILAIRGYKNGKFNK